MAGRAVLDGPGRGLSLTTLQDAPQDLRAPLPRSGPRPQAPGQARLLASRGLSKVQNNSHSKEGATPPGIRRLGVRLFLWPHRG